MTLFDNGNVRIVYQPKSGEVITFEGGVLCDSRHILELVRLRRGGECATQNSKTPIVSKGS